MNRSPGRRGEGSERDEPRSNPPTRACIEVDKASSVKVKVIPFFSEASSKNGKHIKQKHHLKNGKVNAFAIMVFLKCVYFNHQRKYNYSQRSTVMFS